MLNTIYIGINAQNLKKLPGPTTESCKELRELTTTKTKACRNLLVPCFKLLLL